MVYKCDRDGSCVCVCDPDDPEQKRDRKVRPFSMFEATEQPATGLRKNQSSEDLVRDAQVRGATTLGPQDNGTRILSIILS